jgi:hypothetical protein
MDQGYKGFGSSCCIIETKEEEASWPPSLPVRRPVVVSRRIGLPAMNRPPMPPLVRRYR